MKTGIAGIFRIQYQAMMLKVRIFHLCCVSAVLTLFRVLNSRNDPLQSSRLLRLYSNLLLSGCAANSKIGLWWQGLIDNWCEKGWQILLRETLLRRDKLLPMVNTIQQSISSVLNLDSIDYPQRLIMTAMHSRLLYIDLLLTASACARQGITFHLIVLDGMLPKMLFNGIDLSKGNKPIIESCFIQ